MKNKDIPHCLTIYKIKYQNQRDNIDTLGTGSSIKSGGSKIV